MDETEDENTDEEYFSPSDAEDSDGNKKLPKIIMYCKYTHYEHIPKHVYEHIPKHVYICRYIYI